MFVAKLLLGIESEMSTEQLLQVPALRTDRFSITGFATYSTQETVINKLFDEYCLIVIALIHIGMAYIKLKVLCPENIQPF